MTQPSERDYAGMPDRELDAAVAEMMGCKVSRWGTALFCRCRVASHAAPMSSTLKYYTTDLNCAAEVVRKVGEMGQSVRDAFGWEIDTAVLMESRKGVFGRFVPAIGYLTLPARAICLAALRAVDAVREQDQGATQDQKRGPLWVNIDGKRFTCKCGCRLFTAVGDKYTCNSCGEAFIGERETAQSAPGSAEPQPEKGEGL